jgi:hypothetical protein
MLPNFELSFSIEIDLFSTVFAVHQRMPIRPRSTRSTILDHSFSSELTDGIRDGIYGTVMEIPPKFSSGYSRMLSNILEELSCER